MENQFRVHIVMKFQDKDIVKKQGAWYAPDSKTWYYKFDADDLFSDVMIHTFGYPIKSIDGFNEHTRDMLREKIERGNLEYEFEKGKRLKKLSKLLAEKPIIPIFDLYDMQEDLSDVGLILDKKFQDCFESDDEDKKPPAPTAINIPTRMTYNI